jgi:hypothetical protein
MPVTAPCQYIFEPTSFAVYMRSWGTTGACELQHYNVTCPTAYHRMMPARVVSRVLMHEARCHTTATCVDVTPQCSVTLFSPAEMQLARSCALNLPNLERAASSRPLQYSMGGLHSMQLMAHITFTSSCSNNSNVTEAVTCLTSCYDQPLQHPPLHY